MSSIPDSFIDDLVARVDLHDLIGRYITLKKTGSRYMGVCPFHGDSNPSLSVTPDKGFWYCFGCQAGGDAITFIRKQENLDFVEAVRFIAQIYGIPVPESTTDPKASRRKTLIEINNRAAEFFVSVLKSKYGRAFRDYLVERGFRRETVLAYRIGASLGGWSNLAKRLVKDGFSEDDLMDAGVALPRRSGGVYDRFRGRLMIPIVDTLERTIGFGARAMGEDEPKYINSPESQIFQKSKILFGLNMAKKACRETGQLIVMEGYTDVMHAHQAGVGHCCAVMGTALTSDHIPLLLRFAGEVILSFDGDEAGKRACTRSLLAMAGSDIKVRVLNLPAGSDPADLITRDGEDKFLDLVQNAPEGSRWMFHAYGDPVRNMSTNDRINGLREIAPYLVAYKSHPVFEELQEQAAIAFNLNLTAVRGVIRETASGPRAATQSELKGNLESIVSDFEEIERTFFVSLLNHPHYLGEVRELLTPKDFDHPINRKFARIILQEGFGLTSVDSLLRMKEITSDDALYSYVTRLVVESEEDKASGEKGFYTDDCFRWTLRHIIKRQYEAECSDIQSRLQDCSRELGCGEEAKIEGAKKTIDSLLRERQELDDRYKTICWHLGAEKTSRIGESGGEIVQE